MVQETKCDQLAVEFLLLFEYLIVLLEYDGIVKRLPLDYITMYLNSFKYEFHFSSHNVIEEICIKHEVAIAHCTYLLP